MYIITTTYNKLNKFLFFGYNICIKYIILITFTYNLNVIYLKLGHLDKNFLVLYTDTLDWKSSSSDV